MALSARDYLRVSLDRSGRAKSLNEQHADNRRVCTEHGWTLGESYRDRSISASRYTRKAREGYDQLMSDLENGAFSADILIMWESSRGSRRVGEWVLLCDLLAERAITVFVTTHSRLYDPRNPRDRRSLLEDAVDSEYESGKLSLRLRRTLAASAAGGEPPSKGAFGHPRNIRVDGRIIAVPTDRVEEERDAVRGLYNGLFAGRTLASLARELNTSGLLTCRGGEWSVNAVKFVLRNPRNAAIRYHNGERVSAGKWEPIVSEETWQAAVHLLADPGRRTNGGTARKWVGGGLYVCGQCGKPRMRVNYHNQGERVYRCRTGHNSHDADKVDAYVCASVATWLRRHDFLKSMDNPRSALGDLRAESAGLRLRLEQLGVDYAEGFLTGPQARVATEKIETRLAEIDADMARHGTKTVLAKLAMSPDPGAEFVAGAVDFQRATIAAVCRVTLLPQGRGRRRRIEGTVRIDYTDGD